MITSDGSTEYDTTYDLSSLDPTLSIHKLPIFSTSTSTEFYIYLRIDDDDPEYGCFLSSVVPCTTFSSDLNIQFDLFAKDDGAMIQTGVWKCEFYKWEHGYGTFNWIDPRVLCSSLLGVKVWSDKSLSDFVVSGVENHKSLLFNKMYSNVAFRVQDKVVYALSGILATRNEYFRAMLDQLPNPLNGITVDIGEMRLSKETPTVDSEISIRGIDADLFEMIIEWIYTMDIQSLNGLSLSLFEDLESLYVAAGSYQIVGLAEAIESYLAFLVNARNFGEIYQIAQRIESEVLEKDVYRTWIKKSGEFNKSDGQILKMLDRQTDLAGPESQPSCRLLALIIQDPIFTFPQSPRANSPRIRLEEGNVIVWNDICRIELGVKDSSVEWCFDSLPGVLTIKVKDTRIVCFVNAGNEEVKLAAKLKTGAKRFKEMRYLVVSSYK
jgi:hypothetical protein